jgi:hypothetical protein
MRIQITFEDLPDGRIVVVGEFPRGATAEVYTSSESQAERFALTVMGIIHKLQRQLFATDVAWFQKELTTWLREYFKSGAKSPELIIGAPTYDGTRKQSKPLVAPPQMGKNASITSLLGRFGKAAVSADPDGLGDK